MKKQYSDVERCRKIIHLYENGYITVYELEFMFMIITCHNLKAENHPEAEELKEEVLKLMLETDSRLSLHYSLWLAFAPLVCDDPLSFFDQYPVKAVQDETYDSACAFTGTARELPETDVLFPVSINSELLKEPLERHLSKNSSLSPAFMRWRDHENSLIQKRYSFTIDEVLSFRHSSTLHLHDPDAFLSCASGDEISLCLRKDSSDPYEVKVKITYVYADEITALSVSEHPLCLYRILPEEKIVKRHVLSSQEFMGFHDGMFLLNVYEENEKEIHAVIMDPKGHRYDLCGSLVFKYSETQIMGRFLFPDGITRNIDFHLESGESYVLMERNLGYTALLKAS